MFVVIVFALVLVGKAFLNFLLGRVFTNVQYFLALYLCIFDLEQGNHEILSLSLHQNIHFLVQFEKIPIYTQEAKESF